MSSTISKFIAVDPGTERSGVALFDATGNPLNMEVIKGEDPLLDWLEDQDCEVLIIERYRNRPGAINAWSTGGVQQIIGAVKRIARKKGWTVEEQDPSPCLAIGLKYLGLSTTYKGKHVPDQISALAHGEYYLVKNKVKEHRIARK